MSTGKRAPTVSQGDAENNNTFAQAVEDNIMAQRFGILAPRTLPIGGKKKSSAPRAKASGGRKAGNGTTGTSSTGANPSPAVSSTNNSGAGSLVRRGLGMSDLEQAVVNYQTLEQSDKRMRRIEAIADLLIPSAPPPPQPQVADQELEAGEKSNASALKSESGEKKLLSTSVPTMMARVPDNLRLQTSLILSGAWRVQQEEEKGSSNAVETTRGGKKKGGGGQLKGGVTTTRGKRGRVTELEGAEEDIIQLPPGFQNPALPLHSDVIIQNLGLSERGWPDSLTKVVESKGTMTLQDMEMFLRFVSSDGRLRSECPPPRQYLDQLAEGLREGLYDELELIKPHPGQESKNHQQNITTNQNNSNK